MISPASFNYYQKVLEISDEYRERFPNPLLMNLADPFLAEILEVPTEIIAD